MRLCKRSFGNFAPHCMKFTHCACAANTVIKLPARKFSLREREMLFGAGAPNDFFYEGEGSWVAPAAGFGAVVAAVVYIGMLRARKQDEDYHKKARRRVFAVSYLLVFGCLLLAACCIAACFRLRCDGRACDGLSLDCS